MQQENKFAGIIVACAVFLFVFFTIASLFYASDGFDFLKVFNDKYIRHITYFSFFQATLSTILSIIFSIPLSLALYRREFWGKKWLLRLFSMTFVLPVLVAVFGLVAIYGNSGLINQILQIDSFNIYGLSGILLAHIFFNIPLSSKMIYQSLLLINTRQHQLSAQLGLGAKEKFLFIEFPIIKQQLPHIAGLVFMLCFTSFAIVLALGGGPKSTTIEVAIYQAITYDFDLSLASLLALWQILLCVTLTLFIQKFAKVVQNEGFTDKNKIFFNDSKGLRIFDKSFIWLSAFLILPPLFGVLFAGINKSFFKSITQIELYKALLNSLEIAICSASIAMTLAILVILSSVGFKKIGKLKKANAIELSATIILLTPSLVLSTGLFIMLRNYVDVFNYAFYFVVIINSLMALPFIVRSLSSPFLTLAQQYDMLSLSIGLRGFARLKIVEFRALKDSLLHAFSLAFVLSFGDLSSIALFGSPEFKTLPLLLYEQMGSYHLKEASVTALFLLIISIGIFSLFDKSGKENYAKS